MTVIKESVSRFEFGRKCKVEMRVENKFFLEEVSQGKVNK